ncbi:hypothetical protein [Microscilla marina]|uniref:Uncharacterized protein n=1 Tax=Microscilla marina ATCC 23134 TaxID=313606 RepID=A1ZND7_MICM2|nr:hypothetical protein [Microscilla marina]EAY28048.1 hypothetical protein M23134_02158 [Microscilla marina ATCC 23134]
MPTANKTSHNTSSTSNDTTQMLRQVIDLPKLQPYYHSNLPERVPLVVEKNQYVLAKSSLKKFDQPVVFLDRAGIVAQNTKAYLVITKLDIDAQTKKATVEFTYPIEGIDGQVSLSNSQGKWEVVKSSIQEQ